MKIKKFLYSFLSVMIMTMLSEAVAQKLIKIVAQNVVRDFQLVQITLMGFFILGLIVCWASKFVER